tara:strand:- start:1583 stop:2359 length:777 start_codon:yes stop_codon:yes gene_type:complete
MGQISRISIAAALAALAVTPVHAAELPRIPAHAAQAGYAVQSVLSDGADEANQYRRYRYRHHRDRTDLGDVIAGALIIGGIFAVASAATKSNDRYDRNDRDYVSNDAFDRAVDRCVDRVEREQRIGSVDNVGRTRSGYSVSGSLYNGTPFSCQVSGSGRVLSVDFGRGGVAYQSGGDVYGDPQFSDDTYARARAGTYSTPDRTAQPAYPGGPVPGDDGYDSDPYGDEGYGDGGYGDGGYGDAYEDSYADDYSDGEPYR